MTEPRVLARQIRDLLQAFGWECRVNGGRIDAREPAFRPIDHVFLAGQAAGIKEDELREVRPEILVIEDDPPAAEAARLQPLAAAGPASSSLTTFSRFADELWEGSVAATRARFDSESREELPLLDGLSPAGANPQDRHVDQKVSLEDHQVPDFGILDEGLPVGGGILAISAEAGLGKTELLKLLEWRHAVAYEAARSRRTFEALPPLALRVPLRGLISLSLDSIARCLAETGASAGVSGLRRIPSGEALTHLLTVGRIILLLDGLDELAASRDRLEEGLRALREVASSGGRIVVSTREGHIASVSPIRAYLSDQSLGRLLPLELSGGIELLTKYGASHDEATSITSHLPRDVVGIPLFLVLAYAARLEESLPADVLASRALTLLELVRHFCARDEERIRLSAEIQMEMLRDLSDWLSFGGSMSAEDAMEILGLVPGEQGAALIENPHALLSLAPSGVAFRYGQFQHLFLAKAISDKWEDGEFERDLSRDMGKLILESATMDYLGVLLESRRIQETWQRSWNEPLRSEPFLRRNLLGIALAMLEERGSGETPDARSKILSDVLGNRNLAEVNLIGLSIDQVDLRGWDLRRIRGRGGHIRYCPNLPEASTDNSILTVGDLEGCEIIEIEVPTEVLIQKGKERLEALLRPWINQRVRPPSLKPEIAVTTKNLDYEGMRMLASARLAELVRGPKGAKFWKWTAEGRDTVGRFVANRDQEIPALRLVLVALGR